jgi:BirA family biotin operon repressor/biotin-[acetyl-CoA-carboxylase] ligase
MQLDSECLSLEEIEKRLTTRIIGRSPNPNEVWAEIGSTNTRAAELAAAGAVEGVFVAARQQSAGRGRLGRTWVSPMDSGIYLSVILKPLDFSSSDLAPITLACGVAASRAIEKSVGIRLGLKWVNDLVYEGRKLGGILAEMPGAGAATDPAKRALIVGFGLNLRKGSQPVPEELEQKMGWLEQIAGAPLGSNAIAAQLLAEIEAVYEQLKAKKSDEILSEWRTRSVTLGRDIMATSGTSQIRGTAIDIDNSGALLVQSAQGQIHHIHAGEVSIRSSDGKYI